MIVVSFRDSILNMEDNSESLLTPTAISTRGTSPLLLKRTSFSPKESAFSFGFTIIFKNPASRVYETFPISSP